MTRPTLSVDDFEIGQLLGQGGYGNVYLVREKQSHFICAMKVLDKQQLIKSHNEEQILLEIRILMKLKFLFLQLTLHLLVMSHRYVTFCMIL